MKIRFLRRHLSGNGKRRRNCYPFHQRRALSGQRRLRGSRTGKSGAYIADAEPQTVTVRRQEGRVTGGKFLFINYLKRGTITGKKGCCPGDGYFCRSLRRLMGLFKEGTGNFTIDNTYLGNTALSGSGGEFRFEVFHTEPILWRRLHLPPAII